MIRLAILAALIAVAVALVIGLPASPRDVSSVTSDRDQGTVAALDRLTVSLSHADSLIRQLVAATRAVRSPDCFEDAVVVWTGERHDLCVALDDLICGPGVACAQAVRDALQRAGVYYSELGPATSLSPGP